MPNSNRVATEETLSTGVTLMGLMVRNQIHEFDDFLTIKKIVQDGMADKVFQVGDQIPLTWNNGTTTYDCPMDVVAIRSVIRARDNATVPGMILQTHYAIPGIQFDGNEAFYYCSSALAAGTYYFTIGTTWGSNCVANKSYYFTLGTDVPAGGQLVLGTASSTIGALPDTAPANWRVLVYESQTTTTIRERLTLTEGTTGTSLGTLSSSTKFGAGALNNLQCSAYGYNRWSKCGARQYLNSSAAIGQWYTPQHDYDRPPDQLTTARGFMAGFSSDFLDILEPVKITTALNTTSDSDIGTTEVTTDTFFLPSLQEEYCVPQLADVEGEYWPYWKERLGLSSPQAWYAENTNANHIRYLISNTSSAQYVRLRSSYRSYANSAWNVNSTGYVGNNYATYSDALAPACVVC